MKDAENTADPARPSVPDAASDAAIDSPEINRGTGRRYPRNMGELDGFAGMSPLAEVAPFAREFWQQVIGDLGGEEHVPTLARATLRLGTSSMSMVHLLENEIADKAMQSIRAGRTPHPSRYRATQILATFLDCAGRHFKTLGLKRVQVDANLAAYLQSRQTAQEPPVPPPDSTPEAEPDRPARAEGATGTAATDDRAAAPGGGGVSAHGATARGSEPDAGTPHSSASETTPERDPVSATDGRER